MIMIKTIVTKITIIIKILQFASNFFLSLRNVRPKIVVVKIFLQFFQYFNTENICNILFSVQGTMELCK